MTSECLCHCMTKFFSQTFSSTFDELLEMNMSLIQKGDTIMKNSCTHLKSDHTLSTCLSTNFSCVVGLLHKKATISTSSQRHLCVPYGDVTTKTAMTVVLHCGFHMTHTQLSMQLETVNNLAYIFLRQEKKLWTQFSELYCTMPESENLY